MNLKRKLEILNAMADEGRKYPADRVYRDGDLALATNGFQLLAFHLSGADLESPHFTAFPTLGEGAKQRKRVTGNPAHGKTPARIRRWLTREAKICAADLTALRDFLRAGEYLRCPCCAGSGRRPLVEGVTEGVRLDDPFGRTRPVRIGGVPVNANPLVEVLARLPAGETVSLSTWREKSRRSASADLCDGRILRLAGDGWTLIQMGLTDDMATLEAFPLAAAAAIATAAAMEAA